MQVQIIGTGSSASVTVPSGRPNLCLAVSAYVQTSTTTNPFISGITRDGVSLSQIIYDNFIRVTITLGDDTYYFKANTYLFGLFNPSPGNYSLTFTKSGTLQYVWYLLDNVDTDESWTTDSHRATGTSDSIVMVVPSGAFRFGSFVAGGRGYIGGEVPVIEQRPVAFYGDISGYDNCSAIIPVAKSSTFGGQWSIGPYDPPLQLVQYQASHLSAWIPAIATTKTPLFALRGGQI